MAKRALTEETYNRLVAGYRQTPGNASQAGRAAGVDRRTAARAWEKGWPQYPWGIPIRNVIQMEREAARVERARLQDEERINANKERDKARADSARANTEEAQAVSIARQNAISMSALIQNTIRAMIPLTKTIEADLQNQNLSPQERITMLGKITQYVKQSNEASRIALELERIRLGQPMHIFNAQSHLDDVTTEEAVIEIMGVQRTIKRALAAQIDTDEDITIDVPHDAYGDDD